MFALKCKTLVKRVHPGRIGKGVTPDDKDLNLTYTVSYKVPYHVNVALHIRTGTVNSVFCVETICPHYLTLSGGRLRAFIGFEILCMSTLYLSTSDPRYPHLGRS